MRYISLSFVYYRILKKEKNLGERGKGKGKRIWNITYMVLTHEQVNEHHMH